MSLLLEALKRAEDRGRRRRAGAAPVPGSALPQDALVELAPQTEATGAHVLGLHASPVLVPLGWLGMLVGTVPVLLLALTLSAGLAAQRLAQMGARTLGPWGALAGLAFALHPNLSHVLSYEFHPGTLALGPLVWTLDALDRRDARGLLWATVAVLLCREDLAAITALTGVVVG